MSQQGVSFVYWLGQAFVVGIGWYVVHRLSRSRDLDKARRDMVTKSADAVLLQVNDLLLQGRSYHTCERDLDREIRVKLSLQDLALQVNATGELAQSARYAAACRSELLAFRRAMTFRHFEDEHIDPIPADDPLLEAVAEHADRLKRTLLRLKAAQFMGE